MTEHDNVVNPIIDHPQRHHLNIQMLGLWQGLSHNGVKHHPDGYKRYLTTIYITKIDDR